MKLLFSVWGLGSGIQGYGLGSEARGLGFRV